MKAAQDKDHRKQIFLFDYLPTFVMGPILEILNFLINACGFSMKAIAGLEKDSFGTVMLTNVGSFGYGTVLAPFPPYAGVPLVVALGAVTERPCVVDHKVEIREMITVGITADHRFTDGAKAMRLLSKFNAYVHDPEKYLSDKESVYDFVPKWKA